MSRSPPRVRGKELFEYLEGEVTQSRANDIVELTQRDSGTKRRFEALRKLRDDLQSASPGLESVDLASRVSAALDRPPPQHRRRIWPFLAPIAAVAASVALFAVMHRGSSRTVGEDDGYQARGNPDQGWQSRWSGLRVFRSPDAARPTPLGERMNSGDGLLFAYSNAGPSPFPYLMVFGVDSAGAVHWFYPSHPNGSANPQSARITAQPGFVELPDRIVHKLPAGPLAIYGLFTRDSLRVSDVERAVTFTGATAPPQLAFEGAAVQRILVQVDP